MKGMIIPLNDSIICETKGLDEQGYEEWMCIAIGSKVDACQLGHFVMVDNFSFISGPGRRIILREKDIIATYRR